ncbi:hypothetical protein BDV26DRAFT_251792 [Aspergillus bertholletiae]|uniref:Uncharacterized protein n=1 Tax=Aspergillus bertholletiae TaxID=1226010 RepID=A0A5N7BNW4_9EURO|nr:hypothetical protein BDV26DRAFT_251792 [Aspergillus bertholletiae]
MFDGRWYSSSQIDPKPQLVSPLDSFVDTKKVGLTHRHRKSTHGLTALAWQGLTGQTICGCPICLACFLGMSFAKPGASRRNLD